MRGGQGARGLGGRLALSSGLPAAKAIIGIIGIIIPKMQLV